MLKFLLHLTPLGAESCRAVSAESYAVPPGQRAQSSSRGLLFGEPGVRIPSVPEPSLKTKLNPLPPILTAHLFPKLDGMLVELLRTLAPEDWERQTVSPKWKVKDVAAHLLDTALRGVSIGRDGYVAESPAINSSVDLGEGCRSPIETFPRKPGRCCGSRFLVNAAASGISIAPRKSGNSSRHRREKRLRKPRFPRKSPGAFSRRA